MKLFKHMRRDWLIAALLACTCSATIQAQPLALSDAPLLTANGNAEPNIMMLFDTSISMGHVLPEEDELDIIAYDPNFACPVARAINAATSGHIRVARDVSGQLYITFASSSVEYDWGNGTTAPRARTQRCFVPGQEYEATLFFGGDTSLQAAGISSGALYDGNYLNWYFSDPDNRLLADSFTSGIVKPGTVQRVDSAKVATQSFLNTLEGVRMGLSTYYSNSGSSSGGASIRRNINDIGSATSAHRGELLNDITDITIGGGTPLSQSIEQLGRYFMNGYNNADDSRSITIHPGSLLATDLAANEVFPIEPDYSFAGKPSDKVVQYSCQQNFILAVTDGLTNNSNVPVSSHLVDYDGDCSAPGNTCLPGDDARDRKVGVIYEDKGDDYMDDIALALAEIDLLPDLNSLSGESRKNNVVTYVIGFGEESLATNQLINDTVDHSTGKFLQASNTAELEQSLNDLLIDIQGRASSAAAVSLNTTSLSANSILFQPAYNSSNWSGNLTAFSLNATTGVINSPPVWDAADNLNNTSPGARTIITSVPGGDGVDFQWANLSAAQQDDLGFTGSGTDATRGQAVLDYIRGDRSNEGDGSNQLRARTNLLGDIVNSSPIYVGAPEQRLPEFDSTVRAESAFGALGKNYSTFVTDNLNRTPVVYVGANGGMLHGFNASNIDTGTTYGENGGDELLAYIPSTVYSSDANSGLHYLAEQDYGHQFYVDLSPTVGDVFVDDQWRTMLVGGLRSGGQGLFALDVTNPDNFTAANAADLVLWEFTNADDPDLGFTYSKPTIVMTQQGWAAIVGNGYNNTGDGEAKVFVLLLEGGLDGVWTKGVDYFVLETDTGTTANPNGMSTPRVADINGDSIADYIYAGDLQGNMWAFDITSTLASEWGSSFSAGTTPAPLFVASDTVGLSSNAQPITSPPILAINPNGTGSADEEPNILVMFGTGQYLQPSDVGDDTLMSYYAVWHKTGDINGNLNKSNLESRELANDTTGPRVTRNIAGDPIDWSNQYGWYIDLRDGAAGVGGERVVSQSSLRSNVLLFNSIIPTDETCTFGGTGWLNAVDFSTGLSTAIPVFDGDGNGTIDGRDAGTVSLFYNNGQPSSSGILKDKIYTSGSGDNTIGGAIAPVEDLVNLPGSGRTGRLSWEEKFQE